MVQPQFFACLNELAHPEGTLLAVQVKQPLSSNDRQEGNLHTFRPAVLQQFTRWHAAINVQHHRNWKQAQNVLAADFLGFSAHALYWQMFKCHT